MSAPPTNRFGWSAAEIREATGGRLVSGDGSQRFDAVTIDSRKALPGEVFVAIKGEVHDGHAFVDQVLDRGLKGIVVSGEAVAGMDAGRLAQRGVVCIAVPDTTRALQDMAAFHRRRTGVAVVAITGSNGKTTTRTMTAAVVAQGHPILATEGNLNNHIGLPLTLLQLEDRHRWAVVELGMNHAGEILRLGQICRPAIGVITNIAPAHLEGLKTLAGVADAKAELLETIDKSGWAVLNADDPMTPRLAAKAKAPVTLFGLGAAAAVRAENLTPGDGALAFDLVLPGQRVPVTLAATGAFMVANALAAAAVGHLVGLSGDAIKTGLETFRPVKGRLNRVVLPNGVNLIDDTYNANPGSMAAAIDALAGLAQTGRALLVAGDMRELGDHSAAEHHRMGELAAKRQVARIYATGQWAGDLAAGALAAGLAPGAVTCGEKNVILDALTSELVPGDWVLVKGSRAMKMETIVAGLIQWADKR